MILSTDHLRLGAHQFWCRAIGRGAGNYSYGASGHLHAVARCRDGRTGYSAAYDAAGELTCRAVGASTCTNATPTGQALGYDALRRLISWQDATTSPTATGAYAYDGSGSRVWQQDTSTSGGVTTTTTTTYILGIAEITSVQIGQAATTTAATRFYPLAGGVSALRDATGLSYVASDQLGTPIATLNLDTGAVLGEQLRAPYGQARYAASALTNGGMRTTYGFTGQREDATAAGSSGLDYFNARSYDPIVGRFTSADSVMGSRCAAGWLRLRRGMVESATDPSGHDELPEDMHATGGSGEEDIPSQPVDPHASDGQGDDQGSSNGDFGGAGGGSSGEGLHTDQSPLQGNETTDAPGARGRPDGETPQQLAREAAQEAQQNTAIGDAANSGAPGARGNPDGVKPTETTETTDPNAQQPGDPQSA